MKLQQLRFLIEVADSGLNVTLAAERLYTSQPGVSKQIRLLESELGFSIFERAGKRFTGITPAGEAIIQASRRVLLEAENFRRISEELRDDEAGTLTIATTHTQARYVLPRVVAEFTKRYPRVRLSIREGDPGRVADTVRRGDADLGIATEALADTPGLVSLPAYTWKHCIIAPKDHPILAEKNLTLKTLAKYPLITYDPAFSGRTRLDQGFHKAGVAPNLVLTAVDSDVIKTYVNLGLGVGIIAEMAFDPQRDTGLQALPAGQLFGTNTTRIAFRQGSLPRRFSLVFAQLLSPSLTPELISTASADGTQSYDI
ncbi:CysB family HTH-type transcriptional regulator [Denitratisoma sp. agr-D3]